jgi:REP element-mobilizing transposase RayT
MTDRERLNVNGKPAPDFKKDNSNHEARLMEQFQQEKPRKLEEETVTYLLEIEAQMKRIDQNDLETKEILVANVFTEIQSRTASAACDRQTNFILEQLCCHASGIHLIQLMQRWKPYSLILARNRYASHVVQVTFCLFCSFRNNHSFHFFSRRFFPGYAFFSRTTLSSLLPQLKMKSKTRSTSKWWRSPSSSSLILFFTRCIGWAERWPPLMCSDHWFVCSLDYQPLRRGKERIPSTTTQWSSRNPWKT